MPAQIPASYRYGLRRKCDFMIHAANNIWGLIFQAKGFRNVCYFSRVKKLQIWKMQSEIYDKISGSVAGRISGKKGDKKHNGNSPNDQKSSVTAS